MTAVTEEWYRSCSNCLQFLRHESGGGGQCENPASEHFQHYLTTKHPHCDKIEWLYPELEAKE